jgi:hypothetical protein
MKRIILSFLLLGMSNLFVQAQTTKVSPTKEKAKTEAKANPAVKPVEAKPKTNATTPNKSNEQKPATKPTEAKAAPKATEVKPANKPAPQSQVKPAPKTEAKSTQSGTDSKTKKDGTPDRRYKENKKLKKDGTPDMRYKENQEKKESKSTSSKK